MLEQELQFDGFASTTALISLVYGVILLIAAILNIRPPDFDVSAEFLSASGRLVNTTEEGSGRLNQVSMEYSRTSSPPVLIMYQVSRTSSPPVVH
jgi:hypothetical protein